MHQYPRGLSGLQKVSMSLMAVLVLLTFVGSNLHAILWQSSAWLVSTVLPAVVVELTNEERTALFAAPLQRNATLDEAARLKAEHMAANEYFAHYSPEGVSPWHWFDQVGYVYAHAGENLAIHFTDSSEVVDAWMRSPTHRENIVGPQYTEIGVGTARGTYEGYETVYVVQLFGTPAIPPAPVPEPTLAPEPALEPAPSVVTGPDVTAEAIVTPERLPETERVATVGEVEASNDTQELVAVVASEDVVSSIDPGLPTPVTEATSERMPEVVLPVTGQVVNEVVTADPDPISAPVIAEKTTPVVTMSADNVVIIESALIATSSGLAVAQITSPQSGHAGGTLAAIVTQPNMALQYAYYLLGSVVVFLLAASIILEARRLRFTQVVYGTFLLVGMGALWYAHALLTGGAVIA